MTARENILKAYRHQKTDWVPTQMLDQDTCIPSCLEEGPTGLGESFDGWGVKWMLDLSQPGPFPVETYTRLPFEDFEDWKELLVFPDYEKYDWEASAAKDTAKWDRENKIQSVIIVNGMLERLNALMGMSNSLMALSAYPEEASELLGAIADHKIGYIKKIAQYYKPDKIQLHDDYGSIDRMLMSPETWREIIKPHLKRIVDATHELGMIYEHHSCGYVAPLVPDFIEMGIDAWNPVQATNDPKALLEKYAGQFCFVGGFDNIGVLDIIGTTYEQKYESIMKTFDDCKEYGSWVASPSMVDPTTMKPFQDALWEVNKPLMEAAGVEAVDPRGVEVISAYKAKDEGTIK